MWNLCVSHISKYNDIINQLDGHKCWSFEEEEPHKNTCLTTLLSEHESVHEIFDLIFSFASSLLPIHFDHVYVFKKFFSQTKKLFW